jgi:predicted nucleotidyltransferase component of viral defense system
VHAANVQRDYVFGWLLAGLAQAEHRLRSSLIMKGGNCFRKAYFEHARFSNDLDFSTQTELCADALVEGVESAFSASSAIRHKKARPDQQDRS